MNPKQRLKALSDEAANLLAKSRTEEGLTPEESQRALELEGEHAALTKSIEVSENAAKALAALNPATGGAAVEHSSKDGGLAGSSVAKSLGEKFVNSSAYRELRKANPNGVSENTPISVTVNNVKTRFKADPLTSTGAGNAAPVRIDDVEDLVYRPERRLLQVITQGNTALPWFQYRQVISKTNNAAIVAEAKTTTGTDAAGGLKPLSTLTTTTAEAREHTYVDGMEITTKELTDDGIMEALINTTLAENLEIYIENIIVNGTGTADIPAGILHTSGVLQQDFVTDAPTSIRKAMTLLQTTSGAPIQGVLMNPVDNENWDLLKDSHGDWIGNNTPFSQNLPTAFGRERIVSQVVPEGTAIVGDFRTIQFLILQALKIEAFNQHKDYAQRNLVYVRAELRALQLIRNASRLAVVDLTGA